MRFSLLICIIISLSTLSVPSSVDGELYTSVEELSNWSSIIKNLLATIDVYMRVEKERLDRLDGLKSSLTASLEQQEQISDSRPGHKVPNFLKQGHLTDLEKKMNPISAFISLHQIAKAIDQIDALYEDEEVDLKTRLQSLSAEGKLPSREDFIGSGKALLRLQTFYELKTASLVEGQLSAKDDELDKYLELQQYKFDNLHMNAVDCFELGKIAYANEDFFMSVEWFQEALKLIEKEKKELGTISDLEQDKTFFTSNTDLDILINELLDYLAFAAYKIGKVEYAAQLTKLWLKRDSENERALFNLGYYQELLEDKHGEGGFEGSEGIQNPENSTHLESINRYQTGVTFNPDSYHLEEDLVIRDLCRSQAQEANRNKCIKKFQFGNYQLSPELKIEILHTEPKVIRILDILTESEATYLRKSALPKLQRSTVQSKTGLATTNFRIAKTAWLSKNQDPIIELIGKRISVILNLNLNGSEDLQVVNYGLGGYYGPHLDAARETTVKSNDSLPISELKQNDRMATILIYLNHVEIGGATVFPKIGLTVRPIERSAVVWYNIQRNGIADEKTLHSGCPVLLGSKWIATLWPREQANSFLRPCGLTQLV